MTPAEMRLSEVPSMPQPQLELSYATAIPSNGGTFTANQEVRIPFNVPSECFVDLKRAYLKFNLKSRNVIILVHLRYLIYLSRFQIFDLVFSHLYHCQLLILENL